MHPEADKEVVIIGSWFHDIGHFTGNEKDHSVSSEKEARKFLESENFPKEKINKILRVVRSHRNNDVKPETIEAKIVCCADSASHFTADVYLWEYILGKIDRDYRDLSNFPEIKKELTLLYET